MKEIDLLDLIRGFMEYAVDNGKQSFPIFHTPVWHEFLFKAKKALENKFPQLECIGRFDWDGPHPKSTSLNYHITVLEMLGIVHRFDGDNRMFLAVKRDKNPLAIDFPDLAKEMLEIALKIPDFLV